MCCKNPPLFPAGEEQFTNDSQTNGNINRPPHCTMKDFVSGNHRLILT